MRRKRRIKVIFDTNVWISFLIGKQLRGLSKRISDRTITIIFTDQLIEEIETVTARPKLRKYFNPEKVREVVKFLELVGMKFSVNNAPNICRDPKDDFLLGLIEESKADYLITGDKDLIALNTYKSAKILTPVEFENAIS